MKKPNFLKYAVVVPLVAGLVALTAPSAKAQSNSDIADVTVTVAAAISVEVNTAAENAGNMDWGLLAAPITSSTVFQMTTNGFVSVKTAGGGGTVLDSDGAVANFKITGQPNESVSFTLDRVNPGASATLSALTALPTTSPVSLGPTGIVTVDVRADLTLLPGAAGNTFSAGSITLLANY